MQKGHSWWATFLLAEIRTPSELVAAAFVSVVLAQAHFVDVSLVRVFVQHFNTQ
jgi:hypothetical protein